MRKQRLVLLAVLITAQLSCERRISTQTEATPSPSPDEQAQIEQILQRYEEAIGGKRRSRRSRVIE